MTKCLIALLFVGICWGQTQMSNGLGSPAYWYEGLERIANSVWSPIVIDADGEMAAVCGQVTFNGGGSKDIRNIGFQFGTVTKGNGSTLTLSLQNVGAGTTYPDEGQDETVSIANADASFASDTWYLSGNLSADRTVTTGDYVCVVLEFDTFQAGDSVEVDHVTGETRTARVGLKSGTWAVQSARSPLLLLKFSDGTYGNIQGASPFTSLSSVSYDTADDPDEYANVYNFPVGVKVTGVMAHHPYIAAADPIYYKIYQGTDLVTNATCTFALAFYTQNYIKTCIFPAEITLVASTDYHFTATPSDGTNPIGLFQLTTADAGYLTAIPGGTDVLKGTSSRVDGGAWGATSTTTRFIIIPVVSAWGDSGGGETSSGYAQ